MNDGSSFLAGLYPKQRHAAEPVMKKTAIPGVAALMVLLLVASFSDAAEEMPPLPVAPVSLATDTGGTTIKPGETLTLDRCMQIALRSNPNILAASHTVKAKWSRVGQAWSAYYPQISLSGGYTKRNSAFIGVSNDLVPLTQTSYNATAALTQTLADFGRTDTEVSIRQSDLDTSREDLRDATGQITFNVKKAYYELLGAEKKSSVLKESVALFEKQLEQAKEFYEAGMKPRFDVTSAEVDLSNQKLKLIGAENALRIARVNLNNAMGVPEAPDYAIEDDTLPFQKFAISMDEARERAFLNRPDIRSAAAQRLGAEESLSLARKGDYPTISGNAIYTRAGTSYPPDVDNWSVSVMLEVPLFSGFLTRHRVGEAKETLSAKKAGEVAVRQNVILTVQQAYLKMLEAEERVGVTELAARQAQENYELAESRYEAGLGNAIEKTDALVKLSDARTNFVTALADYKVAQAELLRAMGE